MDNKIPTLVLPGEEETQPKAEPVTEAPAATEAAPAGAQAAAAAVQTAEKDTSTSTQPALTSQTVKSFSNTETPLRIRFRSSLTASSKMLKPRTPAPSLICCPAL